jgi:hypothetical protein
MDLSVSRPASMMAATHAAIASSKGYEGSTISRCGPIQPRRISYSTISILNIQLSQLWDRTYWPFTHAHSERKVKTTEMVRIKSTPSSLCTAGRVWHQTSIQTSEPCSPLRWPRFPIGC